MKKTSVTHRFILDIEMESEVGTDFSLEEKKLVAIVKSIEGVKKVAVHLRYSINCYKDVVYADPNPVQRLPAPSPVVHRDQKKK